MAPAGTPPALCADIADAVGRVLRQPDVGQRLAALGNQPVGSGPQALADFMKTETVRWTQVIKAAGIQPEQDRAKNTRSPCEHGHNGVFCIVITI
ncbi:MAG: hypothetical protein HY060_26840 [Proteobacteria bacterium]|nr:hypothetical protein [Pseudomonadota bacterium]